MKHRFLAAALLAFSCKLSTPAIAVDVFDVGARQAVDLPPQVAPVLRGEMVGLLGALREVFVLSADGRHLEAGELAERRIGLSAMGQHAGNVRPGQFMPPAMRALAQGLHRSGSEWAVALRTGDRARADAAFAGLLGTCQACHQEFRLKER